jgi:hypothetical protein
MVQSQSSARSLDEAFPTPDGTPVRKGVREVDVRPDPRFGRRSIKASTHAAANPKEDRTAISRPAVRRSLRRALIQFVLAVLVGVSGTLGWQSYGQQMLATHVPTLAWLFSISAAKFSGAAGTPSDPTPVASNLDAVRRSLDQLAARQDQMSQDLATLQALEDDIRQRMSFMPPSPTSVPPAASVLPPRLPQPRAQQPAPQPLAMQPPAAPPRR